MISLTKANSAHFTGDENPIRFQPMNLTSKNNLSLNKAFSASAGGSFGGTSFTDLLKNLQQNNENILTQNNLRNNSLYNNNPSSHSYQAATNHTDNFLKNQKDQPYSANYNFHQNNSIDNRHAVEEGAKYLGQELSLAYSSVANSAKAETNAHQAKPEQNASHTQYDEKGNLAKNSGEKTLNQATNQTTNIEQGFDKSQSKGLADTNENFNSSALLSGLSKLKEKNKATGPEATQKTTQETTVFNKKSSGSNHSSDHNDNLFSTIAGRHSSTKELKNIQVLGAQAGTLSSLNNVNHLNDFVKDNRGVADTVKSFIDFNQPKYNIAVSAAFYEKRQQKSAANGSQAAILGREALRNASQNDQKNNKVNEKNVSRETMAMGTRVPTNPTERKENIAPNTTTATAVESKNSHNSFRNQFNENLPLQNTLSNIEKGGALNSTKAASQTFSNSALRREILEKFDAMINQARIMIKDQSNVSLSARLNPGELGAMTLNLIMQDGVLNAKLLVSNEAVLQQLKQQSSELMQQFQQGNLVVQDFVIDLNSSPDARNQMFRSDSSEGEAGSPDSHESTKLKETEEDVAMQTVFKTQKGGLYG